MKMNTNTKLDILTKAVLKLQNQVSELLKRIHELENRIIVLENKGIYK